MASTKPAAAKPAAAPSPAPQGRAAAALPRGPAASVSAHAAVAKTALAAAQGMPGWRRARTILGEALAAGDSAVLLQALGQAVSLRRRVGMAWQPSGSLAGDDAAAAFAALRKLAVVSAEGQEEPEFEVAARKLAARSCRVASRPAANGHEVLVLIGAEIERSARPGLRGRVGAALGRLVPPILRRKSAAAAGPAVARVTLEPTGADAAARQAALAEATGYAAACQLVAAAVQARAGAIVLESGPQGVAAKLDVDGVESAAPLDAVATRPVADVVLAVAGLDPRARGPQVGRIVAQVEGQPWPCSVIARRGSAGTRMEVAIEQGRPKFKTLADTGMPDAVADRVQEALKLESGLILLAAPRRGGLTTLCEAVIGSADRLLRDFVILEDAAAPRPEIQNVKPVRWDSRTGAKPTAALDAALREYPNVLAVCDLEDAELAKRLVAQAGEGRLVIVGIRAAGAADGISRLVELGIDPQAVARVLLGAVGCRLVRKLCPKCRREYFPPIDTLVRLGIDPAADTTLFRADPAGCPVCTGTGYLGRTAVCEFAAGPTLLACVGEGAEAEVLRKAAAKDGMVSLRRDAVAKVASGTTSVEEVQRVFRKA